jgi:pimeloyl-ACP methyl ester carboxylesterase
LYRNLLRVYAAYARVRHRHAPETRAGVAEFVARRTPADRAAIGSRYPLIAAADLRPVARELRRPVYALAGWLDPIVPWPLVHPWLRRHVPGFRARRLIFPADHNVLGTAPRESAEQVWQWMNAAR